MTENSVASIFKILIKIPIIISVSYLILNIFAFALSYFKILGASYSLQQIVMENNYLPVSEVESFNKYLRGSDGSSGLQTSFLDNIYAVVYTDSEATSLSACSGRKSDGSFQKTNNGIIGNNARTQYGSTAYVGIVSNFHALWPFSYNELFVNNAGVTGWKSGTGSSVKETTFKSAEDLEKSRKKSTAKIDVIHPVIGLQYYSDLE
jgi:hypothetical protein